MENIKVEIVADSINVQGDRLTSMVLTYPRMIHAEMLTHRVFSRNASSSRAVPIQKMIEAVKNNTFCPFEFQKAHKGMQGSEYFTDEDKEDCIKLWLESAELALEQAEKMDKKGISKQIINRILEPYQYYTMLITGSKESWQNFFSLRCPQYLYDYEDNPIYFKSKKDWVNYYNESQGYKEDDEEFTKVENLTDLEWLQINKGQAEIHMMMLAEKIYDVMNESTPKQLKAGEWHIPMKDKIDLDKIREISNYIPQDNGIVRGEYSGYHTEYQMNLIKVSTSLAARTSYTVVGDEKEIDYNKMIEIHDKCKELNHSSVFEHCARAMTTDEYVKFLKVTPTYDSQGFQEDRGWSKNFKGFIQYRHFIENNEII